MHIDSSARPIPSARGRSGGLRAPSPGCPRRARLVCWALALACVSGAAPALLAGTNPGAGGGPPAAQDDAGVVGSWEGALQLGAQKLRMVFHVARDDDGTLSAKLDSPDQGARGIPTSSVTFEDRTLVIRADALQARFEGTLTEDGALLAGKWSQGPTSLDLTLTRQSPEAASRDYRPQTPRPPFPYGVEDVRYPNEAGGFELAGTLSVPPGAGPHPAAIMISGSGPQDRDETLYEHKPFAVIADRLTRAGVAVLRFDDRGTAESGGDFATATSDDFAADVAAGVAFLRTRPEVDPAAVGLIGHSEGGLVAPLVAAEDEEIAFVVLLAGPGTTGERILYDQADLIARAAGATDATVAENRAVQEMMFSIVKAEDDPALAATRLREALQQLIAEMEPAVRTGLGLDVEANRELWVGQQIAGVNSPWMRRFLTYDPVPTLRRVTCPLLALNGELDLQVPARANLAAIETALREARNEDVTVRALPGLNHLFQPSETGAVTEYAAIEVTMDDSALAAITEWVVARVGR